MPEKIVNLRRERKARARKAAGQAAEENAARHGLPKALSDLARRRADKARRDLDAHRRAGDPGRDDES